MPKLCLEGGPSIFLCHLLPQKQKRWPILGFPVEVKPLQSQQEMSTHHLHASEGGGPTAW